LFAQGALVLFEKGIWFRRPCRPWTLDQTPWTGGITVLAALRESLVCGALIRRTTSGRDLISVLGQAKPRLVCSLVHKFGRTGVDNLDRFIKEIEAQPCQAVGEIFVFVDECHRTQSGKLHRTMKAILPNAVFIGFTGTPLLKQDKQTSLEVFGGYIHTYKFSEAVEDQVVLDLVYEARDIDQHLGSEERIDAWFDAKTRGLNDWQKSALREKWGTMQNVLSSGAEWSASSPTSYSTSVPGRVSSVSAATPSW
jgi:type I restriction enzyme R subunit